MPAGTWHLGRIRKQASLLNLTTLDTIVIRDTQPSSPDYLNISQFHLQQTQSPDADFYVRHL